MITLYVMMMVMRIHDDIIHRWICEGDERFDIFRALSYAHCWRAFDEGYPTVCVSGSGATGECLYSRPESATSERWQAFFQHGLLLTIAHHLILADTPRLRCTCSLFIQIRSGTSLRLLSLAMTLKRRPSPNRQIKSVRQLGSAGLIGITV